MFLEYFGLREQPFGVTPDPKYIFWSPAHREALASLYYGIESDRGFTVLISGPGTGKTTLLFHLLEYMRSYARVVFLFQAQCSPDEFLRQLLIELGYDVQNEDTAALNMRLNDILTQEARSKRRFVVFVDEAQNLQESVLELIRLISNFGMRQNKLFQIVLSGQPELTRKLARPELAQLRQRVSIVARLKRLTAAETADYIRHRLKVAGYQGEGLFTAKATALIARHSAGNPRCINNLCFNALSVAFARHRKQIEPDVVREAVRHVQLTDSPLERGFQRARMRTGCRIAAAVAFIALLCVLTYSWS
jgi:general secretion pathway protein A